MKLLKDLIPYQQPPVKISPLVDPSHDGESISESIWIRIERGYGPEPRPDTLVSGTEAMCRAVAMATALGYPDLGRKP